MTTEIREECIGNKTWEAHDWTQTLGNPVLFTTPWNAPSSFFLAEWIFFLKMDGYKINVTSGKNMENIKHGNKQLSLKKRELLKLEIEKKKSSKSSDHEKVR